MLLQVSPVLVAVLAVTFLGERFTVPLVVGLLVAFAGVALIGLSGNGDSDVDSSKMLLGALLCIVSAATYSVSLVLQKPLLTDLSAVHVTWLACVIGSASCLPFAPTLVSEAADAPPSSLLWLVYLGVFPTAIAFTTYAFALRHMTAVLAGRHDLPGAAADHRDGAVFLVRRRHPWPTSAGCSRWSAWRSLGVGRRCATTRTARGCRQTERGGRGSDTRIARAGRTRPRRQVTTRLGLVSVPGSSQPAERLEVAGRLAPRRSRHSHSLRIDDAKPSSRMTLKDSSE